MMKRRMHSTVILKVKSEKHEAQKVGTEEPNIDDEIFISKNVIVVESFSDGEKK